MQETRKTLTDELAQRALEVQSLESRVLRLETDVQNKEKEISGLDHTCLNASLTP
jgi:hypothetical protein